MGLLAAVDDLLPQWSEDELARRSFDVIDVVEICQHWHAGRPKSVIAASLGVDPKTVRKYVAPAEAAGLAPGGEPLSRAEWAALVAGWFPELIDAQARSLTFPAIDAHQDAAGPPSTARPTAGPAAVAAHASRSSSRSPDQTPTPSATAARGACNSAAGTASSPSPPTSAGPARTPSPPTSANSPNPTRREEPPSTRTTTRSPKQGIP